MTGVSHRTRRATILVVLCLLPLTCRVLGGQMPQPDVEGGIPERAVFRAAADPGPETTNDSEATSSGYLNDKRYRHALAVANALTLSMVDCPERVWPGYDWRHLQVILVDPKQRLALLWNDQRTGHGESGVRLTRIAFPDLPSAFRLQSARFALKPWEGLPTLTLDVSGSDTESISLGIHEAFHDFQDSAFSPTQTASSPGVPYPANWQPHYLRQQMITSLSRALFSSDADALGAARYWRDQLVKRFPEEARLRDALDTIEGTAEYVENIGTALGTMGCDVTESELIDRAKELYSKQQEGLARDAGFQLDLASESYQVGFLTGLLLRQRNVPSWQEQVSRGTTPSELLLRDVQPIAQDDDAKLIAKTRKSFELENRKLGELIEPFFQRMQSRDCYVLSIPFDWVPGSFSEEGFPRMTGRAATIVTVLREDEQHLLFVGISCPLESSDGSAHGANK